jgi:hypothetical protein
VCDAARANHLYTNRAETSLRQMSFSGRWRGTFGGTAVSIVRIGLAETKNFAEGYQAIFGGKRSSTMKTAPKKAKKAASKKPKGKSMAKKKAGKKK